MRGKFLVGGEVAPNLSDEKLLRMLEPRSGKGFAEDVMGKDPRKPKHGDGAQYGWMMEGQGFVQAKQVAMNVSNLYGQDTYRNPNPRVLSMDGGAMDGEGARIEAAKKALLAFFKKVGSKTAEIFKKNLPKMIAIAKKHKLGSLAAGKLADKLGAPPAVREALVSAVASQGFGQEGGRVTQLTPAGQPVPKGSELPKNSKERSEGGFGEASYRKPPYNHVAYAYVPSGGIRM